MPNSMLCLAQSMGHEMADFRLKTAKRDSNGNPGNPVLDDLISAGSNQEAIRKARAYEIDRLIDDTDFAWLTDDAGQIIWSLKLEEAKDA